MKYIGCHYLANQGRECEGALSRIGTFSSDWPEFIVAEDFYSIRSNVGYHYYKLQAGDEIFFKLTKDENGRFIYYPEARKSFNARSINDGIAWEVPIWLSQVIKLHGIAESFRLGYEFKHVGFRFDLFIDVRRRDTASKWFVTASRDDIP